MKKVYFLSDLHLGASHMEGALENERKVVGFLDSIKEDAGELYLLGDILDYWFEYKYVVPRGYVRFFGKLAELADRGVKITWLIGNHDIWIFDYIPSELGIEVIDGSLQRKVLGSIFHMEHGDARVGSRKFRFMRSLFRNHFCQWLYAGLHPRWTVGFAYGCSRKSREGYKDARFPVEEVQALRNHTIHEINEGNPSSYFVYGHLHHPIKENLPDGRQFIILGAWINDLSFAVFDGQTFSQYKYEG